MKLHAASTGKPDEPLCGCPVGPGFCRDLERRHARHWHVRRRVGEQARLREPLGKLSRHGSRLVSHEFVDRAIVIVEDEKLALVILGKCDHPNRRWQEINKRSWPVLPGANAPDPTRHPVAKHIAADEFWEPASAIHEPACDRRTGRVWHLAPGLHDWRRPLRPVQMDRITSFLQAPAVIVARLDTADEFPDLEADVAGPELTDLPVEAHLPGVAVTKREDLTTSPGLLDEWIIGGDAVAAAVGRVINVNSEDRGPQVSDILSGLVRIFREVITAVTRRHIEHFVWAEGQTAAVVAACWPGDHLYFAGRISPRHAPLVDNS